MGNISELSL